MAIEILENEILENEILENEILEIEILENEFSSQSMLKFNKNTFNISVNFNQFLDFDVRDNALLYIIHLKNFVNRKKIF